MSRPALLRHACRLAWVAALAINVTIAFAADVPGTMQAIVQEGVGGPDVLKVESLPVPQPHAGQVLVQVYAVAINPLEWRARMGVRREDQGAPPAEGKRAGARPGRGRPRSAVQPEPMIPGSDVAGVIAALGTGVTQWHVGEAVYGKASHGYAQYVLANSNDIAAKPRGLTFAQASGIPTAGITGFEAVKQAAVSAGQSVVIVGAAGGVGSAAVQVAKAEGAKVIAIASSQHNPFLHQLGADDIVNYDKGNPADKIKNADAVINTVDGSAAAALAYVKRGSTIVLPAGLIPRDQCASAGVTCNGMDHGRAPTTSEALGQINQLVDAGRFTVKVEKSFPLDEAGQAQELDRAGHAEGKIVLAVTSAADQH